MSIQLIKKSLTIDKIGVLAQGPFTSSCVHETMGVQLHRLCWKM